MKIKVTSSFMGTLFKSSAQRQTFWVVTLTYILDLLGYSIVFPILAPLLLDVHLHYFSIEASEGFRTTVLGILFASFGITQFIGGPLNGALADQFGRYKVFLLTISFSIVGYGICALGVYKESLLWLFIGRLLTGLCSGNIGLAQSAVADITTQEKRTHAFSILLGAGSLGFIVGPIVGGKLANPHWLHGSSAFIFGAVAAALNLLFIIFFFKETFKPSAKKVKFRVGVLFKDIATTFCHPKLSPILITSLLFSVGWAFWLIFSPTFLVQRFHLNAAHIGDFYGYNAICWFLVTTFLNKELVEKFPLKNLISTGLVIASLGLIIYGLTPTLWTYWFVIPFTIFGGALSYVNFAALISTRSSSTIQGKALGANASMWSVGQAISPLIAGPLAGWNLHSPLLAGSLCILLGFLYFSFFVRRGLPHK